MELKLFKVNAETEYFVIAEDACAAQSDEYLKEHINDSSADTTATEIKTLSEVTEGWLDSIPYGEHNTHMTIKQFMLPKIKEERERLEKRLKKLNKLIESCES